ncbi:hypothetical protein J3Q64DRAFT_1834012 [Phycomyces blakesleeanus]|uniref:Uncharacterized protein n=1 Tax=Phycomyces blakesleeanus TaxID=4837 RepID=A0ABR3B050_PHYBL
MSRPKAYYISFVWHPLWRQLFLYGCNIRIKKGQKVLSFSASAEQDDRTPNAPERAAKVCRLNFVPLQSTQTLQSLNRHKSSSQRCNIQQQWGSTWCTSSEQFIFRTLINPASVTPPRLLNTKLLTIAYTGPIPDLKQPTDSRAEDVLNIDEFGWNALLGTSSYITIFPASSCETLPTISFFHVFLKLACGYLSGRIPLGLLTLYSFSETVFKDCLFFSPKFSDIYYITLPGFALLVIGQHQWSTVFDHAYFMPSTVLFVVFRLAVIFKAEQTLNNLVCSSDV